VSTLWKKADDTELVPFRLNRWSGALGRLYLQSIDEAIKLGHEPSQPYKDSPRSVVWACSKCDWPVGVSAEPEELEINGLPLTQACGTKVDTSGWPEAAGACMSDGWVPVFIFEED
jgi:hypothetical protein